MGKSFAHALAGLFACMKNERNMRIHLGAAALVTACGLLLKISATQWLVCLLFFALVMGAEAVNTAIEAAVDLCSPQADPKAKLAKDAAAAAVLLCAIMAAIAGGIIFLPRVIALFS